MKGATPVLLLEELISNPAAVDKLPAEAIPGLRGKLAEFYFSLDTRLLARLISSVTAQTERPPQGDRQLKINEAAVKLGYSVDYLYRHADEYPFTIRDGRKLRFSEQGIEKSIRQRAGR